MNTSINKSKTRLSGASPGKINKGEIQYAKNQCQATIKLGGESYTILWRRALLIRYYKILGNEENASIKWTDYDSKNIVITVSDEKTPFKWRHPTKELFKTVVHVSTEKKKKFVLTLFYSTYTISVQGQMFSEWIKEEYHKINNVVKELIDDHQKGGNNERTVDKLLENIDFESELIQNTSPVKKQSSEKTMETPETKSKEKNATEKETVNDTDKDVENDQQIEIEKLKKTIHIIESDQIEKDKQISRLIDICSDVSIKMGDVMTRVSNIEANVHELTKTSQKPTEQSRNMSVEFEKITEQLDRMRGDNNDMNTQTVQRTQRLETEVKQEIQSMCAQVKDIIKDIQKQKPSTNERKVEFVEVKINDTDRDRDSASESSEPPIETDVETDEEDVPKREPEPRARPTRQEQRRDYDPNHKDLWIVGTSIIRDLNAKQMYRNKRVKVYTLHDKTVTGAIEFIKSGKMNTKHVLFQLCSNDLESSTPVEVLEEFESLIKLTKECYPDITITVCEVMPRFYDNINALSKFEQSREIFNNLLKDFCVANDIVLIKFRMNAYHFYDGIHFNERGVRIYVSVLKKVMDPILGLKPNKDDGQRQMYHDRGNSQDYVDRACREVKEDTTNNPRYNNPRPSSFQGYMGRPSYFGSNDTTNNMYNNRYDQNNMSNPYRNPDSRNRYMYDQREGPQRQNNIPNPYNNGPRYNTGNMNSSSGKKENVARLIEQILSVV